MYVTSIACWLDSCSTGTSKRDPRRSYVKIGSRDAGTHLIAIPKRDKPVDTAIIFNTEREINVIEEVTEMPVEREYITVVNQVVI